MLFLFICPFQELSFSLLGFYKLSPAVITLSPHSRTHPPDTSPHLLMRGLCETKSPAQFLSLPTGTKQHLWGKVLIHVVLKISSELFLPLFQSLTNLSPYFQTFSKCYGFVLWYVLSWTLVFLFFVFFTHTFSRSCRALGEFWFPETRFSLEKSVLRVVFSVGCGEFNQGGLWVLSLTHRGQLCFKTHLSAL